MACRCCRCDCDNDDRRSGDPGDGAPPGGGKAPPPEGEGGNEGDGRPPPPGHRGDQRSADLTVGEVLLGFQALLGPTVSRRKGVENPPTPVGGKLSAGLLHRIGHAEAGAGPGQLDPDRHLRPIVVAGQRGQVVPFDVVGAQQAGVVWLQPVHRAPQGRRRLGCHHRALGPVESIGFGKAMLEPPASSARAMERP